MATELTQSRARDFDQYQPNRLGSQINASDLTAQLDAFAEAVRLQAASGEISKTTAESYLRGAKRFLAWRATQPDADTADMLRAWKAALLQNGYKPASVNAWLGGVRALGSWAAETHRLPFNPVAAVKSVRRKGGTHSREMLTDTEMLRLLDQPRRSTAQGRRDFAILSLMAYTALRGISIVRADLADLRTESGKLVLMYQGKGHTEKDTPSVINAEAEAALRGWLAMRGDTPGPLFPSVGYKARQTPMAQRRLTTSGLRHMIKAYMRDAGIVGKSTHSIRHSAVTAAIRAGSELPRVQEMAGHKDIKSTMIYYHAQDRLSNPAELSIKYG